MAAHGALGARPYVMRGLRRGGMILIEDGYRYERNQTRNDVIYWRCRIPTCRAPLKTRWFDVADPNARINLRPPVPQHNHEREEEFINRGIFIERCLQEIRNDLFPTTSQNL